MNVIRSIPLVWIAFVIACAPSTPPPPQYPPPQQPYPSQYAQTYPQQPTPPPYPQQPQYPATGPVQPVQPVQPAQPQAPSRPLLPPLVGTVAWQSEVRSVIAEDIAALIPENRARVQGIPLVFDPTLDINAFASCDAQGHPAITGTEGLLETIDAIAQTRATDELFGTQTYDAYTNAVIPNLARVDTASPALPPNVIPLQLLGDARRLSRAREWFDEIVAFTFGHELSHHWLGHTGCAYGSPPSLGTLWQVMGNGIIPAATQPLEFAADISGAGNALDAGRARAGQGMFRWNEEGAYALLDFFQRLERALAGNPVAAFFVPFINTHPAATIRIPLVQGAARTWYLQHPS